MLKKMGDVGFLTSAILMLCAASSVNGFSKYGRGCNDIGCLDKEECVIVTDPCSYGQQYGKDCGKHPTCRKKSGISTPSSSSSVNPSVSGGNTHNTHLPSVPMSHSGGVMGGGYNPYNAGYQPGGYNPGGYAPSGYQSGSGSASGYQPRPGYTPMAPGHNPSKPKDKETGSGFFSNFFSNPAVSQAVSGIIAGQIANSLRGGGSTPAAQPSGSYQPSSGYGGRSSGGSNILGGLLGNVLAGAGGGTSSSGNTGSNLLSSILSGAGGSSGGSDKESSASSFLGSLLGRGGSSSSANHSGSGGLGDILSSRNFGGLFSENSSSKSSNSQQYHSAPSNGVKSYPTQPPAYGNYNYNR